MTRTNEYGQTIGVAVPKWKTPLKPERVTLIGKYGRLEPLVAAKHAKDLYEAYKPGLEEGDWTYLRLEPLQSVEHCVKFMEEHEKSQRFVCFAIIDNSLDKAVGIIALELIDLSSGVIEVGRVLFSPLMKKSILATEMQYLLMAHVFDNLGYRRYQWKCNTLNVSSQKAAERLGFIYEGTFRQAEVAKGLNRDNAWFSVIDNEWPKLKAAFQAWLDPSNFDENGRQIQKLNDFRKN